MMRIHPEGYVSLLILIIFGVLLNLGAFFLFTLPWLKGLILLASIGLFLFVLQFFRDPHRKVTTHPNGVLSPADGKVVVIEKTLEKEYLKTECWQLSIFMSPLDVHANRNPLSGTVRYTKYHPGKYLVAWHPKSSELNERNTVVIENSQKVKIVFRQIAGAVARRICSYVQQGDIVEQGQPMGFIKFGSRVDIFLPLDSKICVQIGQQVYAGLDLLAELPMPSPSIS